MEEFNKLKQKGLVEEHIDKFKELRAIMINNLPIATETYYITIFKGALKEELRSILKIFKP